MDYAQARMQARYGARPDEAQWQRLGGQPTLDDYLAAARATPLACWLAGIGAQADSHRIELALRQHWREAVAELAGWLPGEWRAAVLWCAGAIDLPALAWLAAGEPPLAWMDRDPALTSRPFPGGQQDLLAGWHQYWPAVSDDDGAALRRLAASVEAHLERFRQLPPAAAWDARRALASEAARHFRRAAGTPAAAFAWLLLQALDLERLRADLVLRALAWERLP